MTTVSGTSDWTVVDEGWGRKAVDFAALSEPGNCREYVTMHHRLGVSDGDRLVDVACGAGLAIELARARGAACAGIGHVRERTPHKFERFLKNSFAFGGINSAIACSILK